MSAARSSACLVVAVLVALGACAESADDRALSADTEEAESGTGDGGEDRDRAADEAIARSTLLSLDDLPPGWEEEAAEPAPDDDDLQASLAECIGVDEAELYRGSPSSESPRFVSPDGDGVDMSVSMTPAPGDARRTMEIMSGDAVPGCFGEAVQVLVARNMSTAEDVPEGLEMGDPTFERLAFSALGDESLAFRATLPYAYRGVSAELYFDVALVRVGRAGITASFQADGSPFDSDEAARLTQIVVERVRAANAG